MVSIEDLKPGVFVWWSAERYMRSWSCPAQVTEVQKDSFKVRSLDDFKESGPLRMHDDVDESTRNEMRLASPAEVREFLEKRVNSLARGVDSHKKDLATAEEYLSRYKKTVEKVVAELPMESEELF